MAIWDAIKELDRLQEKAAEGKEIEDRDTFIVRAALKEKGWEGLICEEAISRGYREARGEEITSIPSWYTEEAIERLEERDATYGEVLISPEVQGSEATEEDEEVPGRVFNLLGNMGGEEPEEQEEVCEINEHVRYLNGIHIMRTGNPQWEDFLWTFMKTHDLKPTDMEGLVGPRPWKDDPLWYNPEEEEIPEPIKKEETMEEESKQEYNLEIAHKRIHEAFIDARHRVIVGDDVGWLCKNCNSVWDLDELRCPICAKAEPPTVEHRGWGDAKLTIGDGSLREYMKKHLEIRKTDKDLAIEAMRKALGLDKLEEGTGLEMNIVQTEEDNTVQCEHCGGNDYLECDCCLECENEECICCDNCARFPCQCDKEECPICHQDIPVGEACPQGCDSEHSEIVKLYEEVKANKDLSFAEKVKFMTLLRQKARATEDIEEDDINVTQGEEGEWEEVNR